MKSLFLFLFLFFTETCVSAATSGYACMDLQLSIKNNTNTTCYLLTEELTSGTLQPGHDVVFKIAAGTESNPMLIKQSDISASTALELVYECGESHYIRLYTQKNECGYTNKVNVHVLYKENLSATAETSPANYWSNKAATARWTIQ